MNSKKILIVAPSWIGDLIITQSFLKYLKNLYPDSVIDLVSRKGFISLLKLMPEIDNIYEIDIKHGKLDLIKRYKFSQVVKENNYTESFVLTNSFKSALIPWFANIPTRVGFLGEGRFFLLNKICKQKKENQIMINKFLDLVNGQYNIDIKPKLKLDKIKLNSVIKKFFIKNNSKNIILCPDAEYGSAKRWPEKKWVDLSIDLQKKERNIYILGKNNKLRTYFDKNILNASNIVSLIGQTSLEEAIYLLAACDLVITNDSGLMHVATAADTRTIVIYGSSSPQYTPPLTNDEKYKIVYKNLSCSPCFKRRCPLNHLNCLTKISVKEILHTAESFL